MNARFANNQIFINMIPVHLRADLNMTGLRNMLDGSIFLAIRADLCFGGAPLYSIGVRVRNLTLKSGKRRGHIGNVRKCFRFSAEGVCVTATSPQAVRMANVVKYCSGGN